jgi:hypothetical protein
MLQYQYQAEREAWVRYIRTIETHVFEKFGANISGDLSLLHQPIAAALRIYNAAFEETRRADRKSMKYLLGVKEEGLRDPTTAEVSSVQQVEAAQNLESFMHCADAAQAQMKMLIEPQMSHQRFKSVHWETGGARERPTCLPSALFAMDPGVKDAGAVMAQAYHLHCGQLNRSTNAARLKLVFADCGALMQGLSTLRDMFEVVGLINGFANPTPMGMRALYLIVKVRLDFNVSDSVDGAGDEATRATAFLGQLQLQLLRYEHAQEEAAPHDRLFVERLPAVCHQLDPEDQPFVQEMIAELMNTFRPTSSTARLPLHSQRCCDWRCFNPFDGNSSGVEPPSNANAASGINGGRKAFTSVVRMPAVGAQSNDPRPAIVRRVVTSATSARRSGEDLQEPLLNNVEGVAQESVEQEGGAQRRVLRSAYRTVEEPLDGWTASLEAGSTNAAVEYTKQREQGETSGREQGGVVGTEAERAEGGVVSTKAEGAKRRRQQSTDLYQQHSAAADTMWYDIRWVLEFEQSKQLLLQDLLVLTKTLAASFALFFVARAVQLIKCESVSYSAHERHDCRLSSGAVQQYLPVTNATLSDGEVLHSCNPQLDLSFLDHAFTALVSPLTSSYSLCSLVSATPQIADGKLYMNRNGSEPTRCT